MKKLVIIGAGFAGLKLTRLLKNKNFEIWLIDKNNYHQFQPLLYQVATCGLEPSAISFPLRKVFQNVKNVHIRCAEVNSIDTANKEVITTIGSFSYDYLVLATGATSNFFGNALIEKNALPMKSVGEALYLRNRILQNFENALITDMIKRQSLLNIVVVGGGPTGVEVSGALAEMRKNILPKDYPEIDFKLMNIYLIEAGPKTLASMSEQASENSKNYLKALGVNVQTSVFVKNYDGNEAILSNGEIIQTKTLIWAAGVTGNTPLGLPVNVISRGNRIAVNRFNQVEGLDSVYAVGDIAYMVTEKYPNAHPQVATVANDQASNLAKNFSLMQEQKNCIQFEFHDKGSMATVGRHLAVVDLPFGKLKGIVAWLFWMFLHLMLILGVKNKILVFINWMWKYFTFDQSLRLIIKPYKKE
jgi:NADH dehydrogenase